MTTNTFAHNRISAFPLLSLLHPRQYTVLTLVTAGVSVALAALASWLRIVPIWGAAVGVLAALLMPAIPKWRDDQRRYGVPAMLISILVLAQGFHSMEHIVQWAQYHLLGWDMRAAVGLLSPANAEWVHFVWNWLVLLTIVMLLAQGVRNPWMWLLLVWASAHTVEHTYMFVRYLQVLAELRLLGVSSVTAQGLPGILGQDGWLMRSELTRDTFICRLPGLTTAPRLDVHFWWNIGEVALLLPATNTYMSRLLASRSRLRPQTRTAFLDP